jgi:hypothetical protein
MRRLLPLSCLLAFSVSGAIGAAGNVTFASKKFAAGSSPANVELADFNGDGAADVAVANVAGTTGITVLLDGALATPIFTSLPLGSNRFITGDFNGDGKQDVVILNVSSDSITTLLGNGDGTFAVGTPFKAGDVPYDVVAADFNGDGKLDIAVTVFGSQLTAVQVFLGNGDGTFQAPLDLAISTGGGNTNVLAVGDFNKDGIPDLAITVFSPNFVQIALGNGDGTFTLAGTADFPPRQGPEGIAVADFNGDGKLDVAIPTLNGGVYVVLGNGDGTLQTPVAYPVASTTTSGISLGDFNKDGKIDLAVSCGTTTGEVSVLLGNGDGTFQTAQNFAVGSSPNSIATGGLNKTYTPDLVVANSGSVSILYDTTKKLLVTQGN